MDQHSSKEDRARSSFAESLRNLELARIMGQQTEQQRNDTAASLWGLAMSGGGIRSATFCLGVLQGLARRGLLGAFHYCATVSGGGYIGGYLQAMLHHRGLDETLRALAPPMEKRSTVVSEQAKPSATYFDPLAELRRFSNYLTPNKSAFSSDRVAMVSTYFANTALTFAQLSALIVLVAFLPLRMIEGLDHLANTPVALWLLAIAFTVIALTARQASHPAPQSPQEQEQKSIATSIVPPLLMAFNFACLASLIWILPTYETSAAGQKGVVRFFTDVLGMGPLRGGVHQIFAAIAVATTYLVGFAVWLRWWWPAAKKQHKGTFARRVLKQLIFGPLAALGLGGAAYGLSLLTNPSDLLSIQMVAVAVGTPLLFLIFLLINLTHLGLAYERGDAVSRERWARLMGRCALCIIFAITIPITLTVILPVLLQKEKSVATAGAVIAFVASGVGAALAYRVPKISLSKEVKNRLTEASINIALWLLIGGLVFAAGVFVNYATLNHFALHAAVISALTWYLLASLLDENEFSMNGFYRNRLVRSYLAPGRKDKQIRDFETGLDPEGDDIELYRLRGFVDVHEEGPRPLYPLLCGAVNLVSVERLDWQDRLAASFVFSPLYCGHQPLPSGPTGPIGDSIALPAMIDQQTGIERSALAENHTLGAAMSVSGAAISPNMGYHSTAAGAFLLTLFNARLGWWVENFNAAPTVLDVAGINLLSELLSNTRANGRFAYVTDGGHFENLGIYELVRRRCRFVLSVDATADPDRAFGDLANAVHKCRVDFGVEIEIDTSLMQFTEEGRLSSRCAALGKINYPDGEQGILLYMKPTLLGTESADISNYGSAHKKFPHESTSDQFFDEVQFECYRKLGYESTLRVFDSNSRMDFSVDRPVTVDDVGTKEKIVLGVTHRLYEPNSAIAKHRAHHDLQLTRLFEKLRDHPELSCMDHQLYPGLHAIDPVGAFPPQLRLDLPPASQFRDCFYFVQELLRLMEGVYQDLDLEQNWDHPDNRGWMNLFRHWVWVPMFRLTWSLSLQTHGSRFVRFCETRVGMPRFDKHIGIRWTTAIKDDLRLLAQELYGNGSINFIEHSVLRSGAVRKQLINSTIIHVGILSFSRRNFLRPVQNTRSELAPMRLGIALVVEERDGKNKLAILRIQDHLRRLGIGAAFMRRVVRRFPELTAIEISQGRYGRILGTIDARSAAKQTLQLNRLWTQARLSEKS